MDISFICEKAGTGTLNASRATTATITDKESFALMPRSPFIVVPAAF
jgi:hypothetical protein